MKLKVFRVPIGFHDAYVAVTSRKAALKAWGSDADLFARGIAEEVTDPLLCAAPLAKPGTVIRVSRGTAAEQIAALPVDRPGRRSTAPVVATERGKSVAKSSTSERLGKAVLKPDRSKLDAAEAALKAAIRRYDGEEHAINAEIDRLVLQRDRAIVQHRADLQRLRAARDRAARAFDRS